MDLFLHIICRRLSAVPNTPGGIVFKNQLYRANQEKIATTVQNHGDSKIFLFQTLRIYRYFILPIINKYYPLRRTHGFYFCVTRKTTNYNWTLESNSKIDNFVYLTYCFYFYWEV